MSESELTALNTTADGHKIFLTTLVAGSTLILSASMCAMGIFYFFLDPRGLLHSIGALRVVIGASMPAFSEGVGD